MKATTLAILIAAIALALFLLVPNLSWAGKYGGALHEDKATIAKSGRV